MSQKKIFRCQDCGYETEVYEGRGFMGQHIEAMSCPDCRNIVPLVVGGVIGETCNIGNNVTITAGTKILTHYLDPGSKGRIFRIGEVHIEDDVFIGVNSIICNSITIGKGAIIGAGSIVTKDIPPYQIWAGNPAKFIKEKVH